MSLSAVEREDRQLALAHAVQLAATGRTDPTDTVSYAEDFLGFLRPPAPDPGTDVVRIPREVAQGHAARLRRIIEANPPGPASTADRELAALLDPQ